MLSLRFTLEVEAKLNSTVSCSGLEDVIHAFTSHLDYCNSLFTCLNNTSLECLQVVQNPAARVDCIPACFL